MASTVQLAWRNLGRNRRRSLITGSALAVGIGLTVATYGLMDGMATQVVEALTRFDLGHIQAHNRDYPRKRSIDLTVPNAAAIAKELRANPDVAAVSGRVYAYGLLGRGSKSAGAAIVGVDPALEPRVTSIHEKRVAGRYLDNAPTPWPRGRKLSAGERRRDEELTKKAEEEVLAELDALESLDGSKKKDEQKAAPRSKQGPPPSGEARRLTARLARKLSPPPKRPPNVMIGASLAKVLKAKVGDKIYVITQAVDGAAAEVFVRVSGVFRSGTDLYDRRVYMHLQDLQRLVKLYDRVHEIAAITCDSARAPAVAAAVRSAVEPTELTKGGKGTAPIATVRPWQQIRPDIQRIVLMLRVSSGVMTFIILLVATLGVVNTMLMAVFERTRELGVLKAIGMSAGRILRMIVVETSLLAFASAIAGTAIGLALDLYLIYYGWDLRSFTEGISFAGIGFDPVMRATITAEGLVVPTVILMATCVLASFYPAVRAARLQPAVGMREL